MVIVGVDAHKRTHTMVAIDPGGRKLGEITVEATTDGHLTALQWARDEFGRNLTWAVEDVRALTARLETDLLSAGELRVIRVPTQLMARTRKEVGRSRGKSDPIDALAAARSVLREPDLPFADFEHWSRELRLLLDRRDDLVQHRTAMVQRLLWRVHELDPTHRVRSGALSWQTQQDAMAAWLGPQTGLVAELARDELADVVRLTPVINSLERRLAQLVRSAAPSLVALYGCGELTAARILGAAADISRFKSEAAFARFAGLAPIPSWSGATRGRLRAHKGGHRALNAALHQIAMIQIKKGGPGEEYYRRRREEGDSHASGIHHVKRRIARTVYSRLRADNKHAAVDALISQLERRSEMWASLIIPATPAQRTPRTGRRRSSGERTLPPLPLVAELERLNNEWARCLASYVPT